VCESHIEEHTAHSSSRTQLTENGCVSERSSTDDICSRYLRNLSHNYHHANKQNLERTSDTIEHPVIKANASAGEVPAPSGKVAIVSKQIGELGQEVKHIIIQLA
jgi:hypothetical protein